MGIAGMTMLQSRGMGKLELPPSLEVESSSLADSSRMACSDGDPLRTMPRNTAPKSFPSGDKLSLLKRSAMNYRFSKQMVSPQASSMLNR
jgi:hypothetical protein